MVRASQSMMKSNIATPQALPVTVNGTQLIGSPLSSGNHCLIRKLESVPSCASGDVVSTDIHCLSKTMELRSRSISPGDNEKSLANVLLWLSVVTSWQLIFIFGERRCLAVQGGKILTP
jgi:hypothetical protein